MKMGILTCYALDVSEIHEIPAFARMTFDGSEGISNRFCLDRKLESPFFLKNKMRG
jgi:hypothetical protein